MDNSPTVHGLCYCQRTSLRLGERHYRDSRMRRHNYSWPRGEMAIGYRLSAIGQTLLAEGQEPTAESEFEAWLKNGELTETGQK